MEKVDTFFKDIVLENIFLDAEESDEALGSQSWVDDTLWINEECFAGGYPVCPFSRKYLSIRADS